MGEPSNRQEVLALLAKYQVPMEQWGAGETKTLDHLFKELAEGEAVLLEQGGRLVRQAEGAVLNVYFRHGTNMRLVEDRQVFTDGRVRRRNLDTSIGEKMQPGEHPVAAARRALQEELGIDDPTCVTLIFGGQREKVSESQSYPGTLTKYLMHVFDAHLPVRYFKAEGYVEEQTDKSTYFVWRLA